ncbi:hypothetical protein NQ317_018097, partial [Molorchus minor]
VNPKNITPIIGDLPSIRISQAAKVEKISWSFNVPSSPNVGGLFKTGIKSVKHHLKRVVSMHWLSVEFN